MSLLAASALAQAPGEPARASDAATDASHEASAAEVELARTLFFEAADDLDAGRYAAAEARLRRVIDIRDSPVVRYNLAAALAPQDRLLEARELLMGVLSDPESRADVVAMAQDLLETIRLRLGSVTIRLKGPVAGVSITVNGHAVSQGALAEPIAVDPGRTRVAAERAGQEVAAEVVSLSGSMSPGATVTLTIPPATGPPANRPVDLTVYPSQTAPEPMANPSQQPSPAADGGLLQQWWFWAAIGGAAAAVTATVVVANGSDPEPADPGSARGDFTPSLLEGSVQP